MAVITASDLSTLPRLSGAIERWVRYTNTQSHEAIPPEKMASSQGSPCWMSISSSHVSMWQARKSPSMPLINGASAFEWVESPNVV
jgi:hypothetical protein